MDIAVLLVEHWMHAIDAHVHVNSIVHANATSLLTGVAHTAHALSPRMRDLSFVTHPAGQTHQLIGSRYSTTANAVPGRLLRCGQLQSVLHSLLLRRSIHTGGLPVRRLVSAPSHIAAPQWQHSNDR